MPSYNTCFNSYLFYFTLLYSDYLTIPRHMVFGIYGKGVKTKVQYSEGKYRLDMLICVPVNTCFSSYLFYFTLHSDYFMIQPQMVFGVYGKDIKTEVRYG